jgi:hypothetical protein
MEKRAKDRFIEHISVVAILAAVAVTAVVLLYFNWFSSQGVLGFRQVILSAASCFGMCAVIIKLVPAVERYWGLKPTVFARYHRYRVYLGIAVYLVLGVVIFSASVSAKFGGFLPDALFRFFGGRWVEHLEYYRYGKGDISHYFNIARFGYVNVENDLRLNIVFFPLFPWLLRTGHLVIRNYAVVGMLINIPLTFLSGVMLYDLVKPRFGHDEAARAVKYLLLFPFAFYLFAPMTEALFLFLTIAVFYLMKRKDYALIFLAAFGAGLTRSLGAVLIVPIVIEAGRMIFFEKDKRAAIKMVVCALAPICALGVYLIINYVVYGDPLMFMTFQRTHWHQNIDFFWNTAVYLPDAAAHYWRNGQFGLFMGFAVSGVVSMGFVMALIVYGAKKLHPTYTAYAVAYFVVAFGATWLISAPRYSMVIFPIAMAMARLTRNKWLDRLFTTLYTTGFVVYLFYFIEGSWAIY